MLLKWRVHRLLHQTRRSLAAPSRNPRAAVVLGRLLGIAFILCFVTGLYSHFIQEPLPWMVFLTRPIWLYQVSQGIHITAGIICFPLLFAKLYTIFPELFQTPPVRSFPHFLERASIAIFVAASLVQITIGLLNTYQWYALFPFPFRQTHYALSFVIIGSLAIHIALKLPVISQYWRKRDAITADGDVVEHGAEVEPDAPDELQRLTGKTRNAGVTGRIFEWIDSVADTAAAAQPSRILRDRRRGIRGSRHPHGRSVLPDSRRHQSVRPPQERRWAAGAPGEPHGEAGRRARDRDGARLASDRQQWRHPRKSFSYDELRALPQHEVVLPIACVEGWSQYADLEGPQAEGAHRDGGRQP